MSLPTGLAWSVVPRLMLLRGAGVARRTRPSRPSPRRPAFSNSFSTTAKTTRRSRFLVPGFQPTAIAGDRIGFYEGSTFYEGQAPGPLPTLDLSAILSPGQFCKRSSWTTSHHRHRGTTSGTDAADRLVDARRELVAAVRDYEAAGTSAAGRRRLYSVVGHGVPSNLLRHLTDAARGWLGRDLGGMRQEGPWRGILWVSAPDSTLLDRERMRAVDVRGAAAKMASLPVEWERDFELFMVAMDRMASRMASLAVSSLGADDDDNHDDDNRIDGYGPMGTEDDGTGSVVTPSQLVRWDVMIMKGEALPPSLMPTPQSPRGPGAGSRGTAPWLTMEWAKGSRRDRVRRRVVLRLQDVGAHGVEALPDLGSGLDPVSLVFEGEYVPP